MEIIERVKQGFKFFMIYISIAGLISFSLFIIEEAFQTVMFGSWAAKDAKRWDIVMEACSINRKFISTMKLINYGVGWVNPISFISYRAYGQAGEYWIRATESEILAHEPELFVERTVYFRFKPDRIVKQNGYVITSAGKITVLLDNIPDSYVDVEGKIIKENGRLVVDQRKEKP